SRRQLVASSNLGLPGLAVAKPAAFLEQVWPGRAVDRVIDFVFIEQRWLRGIDDDIQRQRGDVSLDDLDPHRLAPLAEGPPRCPAPHAGVRARRGRGSGK